MKKYISLMLLTLLLITTKSAYSYTKEESRAAEFLGYKEIITIKENDKEYKLNNEISRQEMLKIMIIISGIEVENKCQWKFDDVSDWSCKYTVW